MDRYLVVEGLLVDDPLMLVVTGSRAKEHLLTVDLLVLQLTERIPVLPVRLAQNTTLCFWVLFY